VIFINQIRMKIGVMFGNPETTTGGNALKFYASMRLDIRRIQAIKDGENVIGNRTRVKVVKNKLAPPFKEVEFDILYGEGISKEGDLLDIAVQHNLIEKSGTWFSYKEERIGQGRDNSIRWLKERPEVIKALRAEVLEKSGVGAKPQAASPAAKTEGATPTAAMHMGTAPKGQPAVKEAPKAPQAKK
jgi:recombination protein RecA